MKKENQEVRKSAIRSAAYDLLEEKGYKGTSMLAIAKRAKASNQTLYAWYGTKQNLFHTLIEENAKEATDAIDQAIRGHTDLHKALLDIGALLLKLVTSERAISLNRAAAAEASDTNTLGKTLASAGRESIFPLLKELLRQAQVRQEVEMVNQNEAVKVYLGLLLGDIQVRRVTGAIDEPSNREIVTMSKRAAALFLQLFSK